MRIYTGGGDSGETGLFGGGRVPKDHLRVEAYGALDELNAVIGTAQAAVLPDELKPMLTRIQEELFILGADLATPPDTKARAARVVRIDPSHVTALEADIDWCEEKLPALQTFILPGGAEGGAALHFARTVCRRAERRIVGLARTDEVSDSVVPYVNRLSDFLFVAARFANLRAGRPEQAWLPE